MEIVIMYGQHKWKNINLEMKLFNIVYQALLEFHYDQMSNINMDITDMKTPILT